MHQMDAKSGCSCALVLATFQGTPRLRRPGHTHVHALSGAPLFARVFSLELSQIVVNVIQFHEVPIRHFILRRRTGRVRMGGTFLSKTDYE
eukprot:6207070-Pleurochrysis_carterae.AAC.3